MARSAQQHQKRTAVRSGGSDSDDEEEEGEEDGGPAAGSSGSGSSGNSSWKQQGAEGAPRLGPGTPNPKKPSQPTRPAPKGLGGLGLPAVPLPPLMPPDCSTQVPPSGHGGQGGAWDAQHACALLWHAACRGRQMVMVQRHHACHACHASQRLNRTPTCRHEPQRYAQPFNARLCPSRAAHRPAHDAGWAVGRPGAAVRNEGRPAGSGAAGPGGNLSGLQVGDMYVTHAHMCRPCIGNA